MSVVVLPIPRQTNLKNDVIDAPVIAACRAAVNAINKFDEAVESGAKFTELSDLATRETQSLHAAINARAASTIGIIEKAKLLDRLTNVGRRASPDCAQIALSLAADVIALAKKLK
jgi:hypothetical protein